MAQASTAEPTLEHMSADSPKDDQEVLSDLMASRAQTYGMLSRLFRVEVDLPTIRELQGMHFPVATGNDLVNLGYSQLYDYLKDAWEDSVTELAIDYVRCFIGHGVNGYSAAYPYESVYTSERRLMMQEARAEVLATFRANNLKRGHWNESEDHIAMELEFMQRIALRTKDALLEGDEDHAIELLKTQLDFANDHLVNWLPMLVNDMQQFSHTLFYQGLGNLTLGFVQEDKELIEELLEG